MFFATVQAASLHVIKSVLFDGDASPEFLQRALLIGEEESKQRFPLQKDDQGGYQEADQGDQDCHSNDHAVG